MIENYFLSTRLHIDLYQHQTEHVPVKTIHFARKMDATTYIRFKFCSVRYSTLLRRKDVQNSKKKYLCLLFRFLFYFQHNNIIFYTFHRTIIMRLTYIDVFIHLFYKMPMEKKYNNNKFVAQLR